MDRYTERVSRPTLNTPERKDDETTTVKEPVVTRVPQPGRSSREEKKKVTKPALFGAAGIVVVLGLLWWFFGRNFGVPSYIETNKYQVVCLQSGECYFGKISSVTSDVVQIKNVFYVQKTSGTDTTTDTSSSDNNLQLIKLGNEVHGPEDLMVISRSQVLYMENLKSDGKVTQTINSYYEQNKK